tara:strand:+ start:1364 stop:1588 length:225 start_codon:yes stop_codon:yes gene_type:complete
MTTGISRQDLEKIYGPLHPNAVSTARDDYKAKMFREGKRETRRLAGIRRREKITGKTVGYFGQGLGAHKRPGRR